LTAASDIRLRDDPPSGQGARYHRSRRHRLRPLLALLALVLAVSAGVFGIATSQTPQPDALMLFSCGPCHD
jgi:hypothetical protein